MTSVGALTTESRSIAHGRFPLSAEQRARVERDNIARDRGVPPYPHHETAVLHLGGALDNDALAAALDDTIGRHAALRLQIVRDRDGWWQIPTERADLALERTDLSSLSSIEERDTALQGLVDEQATRPFDLDRGPLVRAMSIRLAPDVHVLAVTTEHLVCDGWSLGIMLRDLGEAYSRRCGWAAPPRPGVPRLGHVVTSPLARLLRSCARAVVAAAPRRPRPCAAHPAVIRVAPASDDAPPQGSDPPPDARCSA